MVALETLRHMITDAADPDDREDVAIRGFLAAGLETVIAMYPEADVPPCARMRQKQADRSSRNRRRGTETHRRTYGLSGTTSPMLAWTACRRGRFSPASFDRSPDRGAIPAALRRSR